ncbi:asparagine synthase-related protein [Haloarcula nitratireducens]|uniref:Asparagine synthase n=1 Tax=Haloarcula nitratireducens TaxID=2487749 RepID=A0AAW4PC22_9EURY|nr:asparagine synthase-related protein [Halomicroarcula nitratireducens]MBX0295449.1 asparagine synthase [Halomicroarcula nitratireducens]
MVGLCGATGVSPLSAEALAADIEYNDSDHRDAFSDDRVAVASVRHPGETGDKPATAADGDVAVWLWGDVWGDETDDGYVTVETDGAAYCAERYAADGTSFLSGVNGNFTGVIYDRARGDLLLLSDRLGTRPIHYYETDDGVVFSTNIQSLPLHPAVDTDFDLDYLTEYFSMKQTYGVKTPLRGVEKVHPGSVVSVDVDTGETTTERYWEPVYDPVDASAEQLAEQLAETMKDVVADWTADSETDYGLLLSGGSDSRLVLAALDSLDVPVTGFHLNEWRNREARIAERVADAVGIDFQLLKRGEDYQAEALERESKRSNFVGYFNQNHAGGFADRLRSECDMLLTGHYGDTLFKGDDLPTADIDLGPAGSFDLPVERRFEDLDALIGERAKSKPSYLRSPRSTEEIYAENVTRRGDSLVDHGVEYRSLREATVCKRYPVTNSASQFFLYATAQFIPSGTPFLDNRLIDLFLKIPAEHFLRGDLINRATAKLSPPLAEIPHGRGLFPIRYPFALNWTSNIALSFADTHLRSDPARAHWTRGPWTDHNNLIRNNSFIRDTIDANEERIRELPFLDWDGVVECYEAHCRGEDRMKDLYTLATFLNMPLLDRIDDGSDRSLSPSEPSSRQESAHSARTDGSGRVD